MKNKSIVQIEGKLLIPLEFQLQEEMSNMKKNNAIFGHMMLK